MANISSSLFEFHFWGGGGWGGFLFFWFGYFFQAFEYLIISYPQLYIFTFFDPAFFFTFELL